MSKLISFWKKKSLNREEFSFTWRDLPLPEDKGFATILPTRVLVNLSCGHSLSTQHLTNGERRRCIMESSRRLKIWHQPKCKARVFLYHMIRSYTYGPVLGQSGFTKTTNSSRVLFKCIANQLHIDQMFILFLFLIIYCFFMWFLIGMDETFETFLQVVEELVANLAHILK